LLLAISPIFVSANSVQSWWSGTDSTGAIITSENCPLIVEKEVLTFDINELPQGHYFTMDEFLSYTGKVTAQYSFYNPAEYKVDATIESSPEGFEYGNPGYELHLTGLPEGELHFKLSEDADPKIPYHSFFYFLNSFGVLPVFFILVLLFLLFYRRHKQIK